ncbi:MAG: RNA polymerase-associated protein RapA [Pseudomonadales bacterium]|nr:RNA polymerase-associated protein RapA [Pseudomonadales bacterium]
MQEPSLGQRWISEGETELGLGMVVAVEARTVTLLFPGSEETRVYARRNATIARIRYDVGDNVLDLDGQTLQVTAVIEQQGILSYQGLRQDGQIISLPETRLAHQIQLARPQERLLAGQLDANEWFNLRYDTLLNRSKLMQQPTYGLGGARVGLLPHQLYVASEVARRHAPRVLLADEVGLGKTIEAGLILHQQLLMGRLQRILIIVPENLQNQWLVELLRRFNLRFSLFNTERLEAETESSEGDNPFLSQQLIIMSLETLLATPEAQNQAVAAGFDMLVVDEAHHLAWSPESASPAYLLVERLSLRCPGVLLLTATPEQLGLTSHFARLRLLDPQRFHDYEAFITETHSFQDTARLAQLLMQDPCICSEADIATLQRYVPEVGMTHESLLSPSQRLQMLNALLDRHGTGRLLFRNTRHAVQGFMPRHLHIHPLDTQPASPDELFQAKVQALLLLLKELRHEKVLLICKESHTALDLEDCLRLQEGIRTSMFHEGMSLLERDRAAAYFSDLEAGAQILICSEIGSEGRNFQFACHLIMFDLPEHPDLLEQRIGRLDRIGQKRPIHIHVLSLSGSAEQRRLQWYHEGLNAFEHTCAVGAAIFAEMNHRLHDCLETDSLATWTTFIEETTQRRHILEQELEQGRDRLLELNSCRPEPAEQLVQALTRQEEENSLPLYMERIFQQFGVDIDDHGEDGLYLLRPGDHMLMETFPELDEDGLTLTYDRERALSREDVAFLTWEHPMVSACMDMLTHTELGNANVALIRNRGVKTGTLLLEALFVPELQVPKYFQLDAALKEAMIRILIDTEGRSLGDNVAHMTLRRQLQSLDRTTARNIIKSRHDILRQNISRAELLAKAQLAPRLEEARVLYHVQMQAELHRLRALQHVNPAVRDDEIEHLNQAMHIGEHALSTCQVKLYALRLIVAGEA